MKSATIYFALFSICFLGSSCENFFSTTLKVDPPPHEDQLVIHSYLNSNDSLIVCSVTKSSGLLEDVGQDQYQDDAKVSLYKDGQLFQELEILPTEFRPFNFGMITDAAIESVGSTFEIKVSHPTFGEVSAIDVMPARVELTSVEFEEDAVISEFGGRDDGIRITFNDPAGVANYYEFTIVRKSTLNNGEVFYDQRYAWYTDPNVREGVDYNSYLLTDETFDGKKYQFEMYSDNIGSGEIFILWRSITRSTYLYSKSVSQQRDAVDLGAFADPVSIFSNIENGLGIFGLKTESLFPVER